MADRGARRRTSFGPTVVAGGAAAALAAVAAGQPWGSATALSPAVRTVVAKGSDVAPAVLPLALVALAAWGTVLVLRRRGRRVVAVLGVLAAAAAGVTTLVQAHTSPDVAGHLLGDSSDASLETSAWPYVAMAACLVSAAASVVAFLRAPGWPEMSSRYDAPGEGGPAADGPGDAPAEELTDAELWKALDAGHDPTAVEGRPPGPNL